MQKTNGNGRSEQEKSAFSEVKSFIRKSINTERKKVKNAKFIFGGILLAAVIIVVAAFFQPLVFLFMPAILIVVPLMIVMGGVVLKSTSVKFQSYAEGAKKVIRRLENLQASKLQKSNDFIRKLENLLEKKLLKSKLSIKQEKISLVAEKLEKKRVTILLQIVKENSKENTPLQLELKDITLSLKGLEALANFLKENPKLSIKIDNLTLPASLQEGNMKAIVAEVIVAEKLGEIPGLKITFKEDEIVTQPTEPSEKIAVVNSNRDNYRVPPITLKETNESSIQSEESSEEITVGDNKPEVKETVTNGGASSSQKATEKHQKAYDRLGIFGGVAFSSAAKTSADTCSNPRPRGYNFQRI
jgi:hypothetical protein